ncbi:acyl-CoA reductase [Sphingopyxis terrae]|uniref:acyl-CoA reductase n=1 Tax=Sphingopyxis terrae TaxID=33052 RepID=UPI000788E9B8|nr:acyl-CoA reductase [Sphingopyxis terrae]
MTFTLWNPAPVVLDDTEVLRRVEALTYAGRAPLAKSSLDLLGAISKALFSSPQARVQPQYVALAYWLRPAALERLAGELRTRFDGSFVPAPRGLALHLPPTNVDTIFVYSWAVSVLAGNCNIIRLPSQLDEGTAWLAGLIATTIAEAGEGDRHLFCQMPQDGPLIEAISRHCDLRMIWGGDAKVDSVSRTPIRPDGLSIGFPDRKSLAVICAASYRAADETERDALAARFFNDIYWFNQMGCGSPRMLYWVGESGDLAIDLYDRLDAQVTGKGHLTETGVAIGKFAAVNDLLAEGIGASATRVSNALHVLKSDRPAAMLSQTHGGGLLGQTVVGSIIDIAADVGRKVQTIGHFGFDRGDLEALGQAIAGRGGYRIVPIGQALQFDILWDGVDLFDQMTRRIAIRL